MRSQRIKKQPHSSLVSACIEIIIKGETPPSENVIRKLHWAERKRIKDKWYYLIREQVRPQKVYFRKITITGILKRRFDFDNWVGANKSCVLDNLKKIKLIEDDFLTKVKVEYNQEIAGKRQIATIIKLELPEPRKKEEHNGR